MKRLSASLTILSFPFFLLLVPGNLSANETLTPYSTQPLLPLFSETTLASTGTSAGAASDNSGTWFHPGDSDRYMDTRRTMLRYHQLAGMLTWTLWLATNLEGEKALDHLRPQMDVPALFFYSQNPSQNLPLYLAMRYDNPAAILLSNNDAYIRQNLPLYYLVRNNVEWEADNAGPHKNLAAATMGMYALTAGLALFSPGKYGTQSTETEGFDSIFFHKGLALLHFAAMAALPSLGARIERGGPNAARQMQNTGWAGFGALTVAFATVTF